MGLPPAERLWPRKLLRTDLRSSREPASAASELDSRAILDEREILGAPWATSPRSCLLFQQGFHYSINQKKALEISSTLAAPVGEI